ncbi:neurite extension and migration factor [Latimeria chalumnae]|nr:PREDICTED: protein KIAA2022 homolog [Latimeria chalumnae]XP_014343273.1 PREDICTED: protein KIAA2022 homolog [Latimeria chalumnae]XP_014343274.1 PREDICTED: protein KIAA2022 homolog [Latimeria chalumnae]|eukprot:XP_014343272.1 PREDICTED: protein KIAA2022 homolog [Latimeria chalumnae]
MDDQQDKDSTLRDQTTIQVNGVNENESHDQRSEVKLYAGADAAITFSSLATTQKENPACHRVLPSKEACLLSPPSPLRLVDVPEHISNDSSSHAISLTSCIAKGVTSWALPEDCDKTPFTIMEPGGMSALTGDCLMQQSRTCLGCFIESKDGIDGEPEISLKVGDINRDYDTCSVSDIGIQCMSTGEAMRYGDQLLSDQLLSFPVHKLRASDKRDAEKSDSDSEDSTQKNYYEGLLLDKCNGDEVLLSNPSQEWGYFESFISESKIELLDLCSKNELSVNLFSEEDVDNYMFDDDDSTLGSDVCSLKIRYESFQDNVREKTNAFQEEAQFNFFPSVFTNCSKKESKSSVKKNADPSDLKSDDIDLWVEEEKHAISKNCTPVEIGQLISSKRNHFLESHNSAEDSGEFSDDSSCTEFSYDTMRELKDCTRYLSREHSSSSMQQNYGLRAKRKVRYSDDYLYDVDSIESEKVLEKREWLAEEGPKEEDDDDWCPKKRRKASRKEPPVIIKYIIINRFKGEKHMLVKLSKIDATQTTVTLSNEVLQKYEKLAPLKEFWQKREQRRVDFLKSVLHKNQSFHMNGSERAFFSHPRKRKCKIANRHRIHRIHTVEQSLNKPSPSSYDHKQACSSQDDTALKGMHTLAIATPSCANGLDLNDITSTASVKSKSQEREDKGTERKILRRIKFKSEARLKSKKIKAMQEDGKAMTSVMEITSVLENQDSVSSLKDDSLHCASDSPHLSECCTDTSTKNSTFLPATCSADKTTPSANITVNVPVVPGGYLQTLLDASDSSNNTGISYFTQEPSGQRSLSVTQAEKQLNSLHLAQSCVLSPPSESELQQSPHHAEADQSFSNMWHSQTATNHHEFIADIRETAMLSNDFGGSASLPTADNLAASGYNQINLNSSKQLYHKNYMHDNPLQSDASYQLCHFPGDEGRFHFQRGTLSTDDGRLISFDSVGSLSVSSSNYSSLSLKTCEKDGEEDMNDDFLAHCSPKLVIQQSLDEIAPLKESTDLLDISNFTPDKFRHSSLSEMSPPETPNLSPQLIGPEVKSLGNAKGFQDCTQGVLGGSDDKWNCNVLQQQEQPVNSFTLKNHQFQFHMFNDEDTVGLLEKSPCLPTFVQLSTQSTSNGKAPKAKKKASSNKNSGPNQSSNQKTGKKTKSSKASKAAEKPQTKAARQTSKSAKKEKNTAGAKHEKVQVIKTQSLEEFSNITVSLVKSLNETIPNHSSASVNTGKLNGVPTDWPVGKESKSRWSEHSMANTNNLLNDDQREFEEPSNILSNIASGMADVQRFMMASIEPLWSPVGHQNVSGMCQSAESNNLKLKTLKILAGTTQECKKKASSSSPGAAKSRKSTNKGSTKNNGKSTICNLNRPSSLTDCSASMHSAISVKSCTNFSTSGNNGPTHKKVYRHKSSSKSQRDENYKTKRTEREQQQKGPSVTAFEKLR